MIFFISQFFFEENWSRLSLVHLNFTRSYSCTITRQTKQNFITRSYSSSRFRKILRVRIVSSSHDAVTNLKKNKKKTVFFF